MEIRININNEKIYRQLEDAAIINNAIGKTIDEKVCNYLESQIKNFVIRQINNTIESTQQALFNETIKSLFVTENDISICSTIID